MPDVHSNAAIALQPLQDVPFDRRKLHADRHGLNCRNYLYQSNGD
eukprot:CAMPEP_0117473068 /NCGR_PEP_ID=MMETSP0784-20121206/8576_1 /TAXON_ID=39447 /ORGANISM="" /LENGTH=44 /DNA_ID= /DNA_START= /DNA_END= /DNA_ORIENTATION=